MLLPLGVIALWAGAIIDIPAGWALCDGSGGTTDLTNLFVVGAGDTYAVDDTGGAVDHNHSIDAGADIQAGFGRLSITDTVNHLPPYYALAYIQRV